MTKAGLAQAGAFVKVAARELTWTLPMVRREVRRWREIASGMPPGPLRDDALLTLDRERLNTEGAALFSVLPQRRNRDLLEALVAYEVLLDYLDTITERPCADPLANGRQLHWALVEAVDPGRPLSDHYRHHPWQDDGGYIQALIEACRRGCLALPSYAVVQSRAVRGAELLAVQVFSHDPDPGRRRAGLRAWAEREFPDETELDWHLLAAAASSTLWTHVMLALACEPELTERDLGSFDEAYFPWVCAANTLLDHFVDQLDDARDGKHNFFDHYATRALGAERLRQLVLEATERARGLRRGRRHELIAAGMVAMYLTKDSATHPELRADSERILRATGPVRMLQLPILRTMRAVHGLQSA